MADTDLAPRALHDFLRAAFPWHAVIDAEDRLRSVGPMLERLGPSLRSGLALSAVFQSAEPAAAPLSFRALLERGSTTLEVRHPFPSLRLSGPVIRLPDPSTLAFLASPELHRGSDLIELSRSYRRSLGGAGETPRAPATAANPPTPHRRPKVLVVDDHPVNRLLATELLRQRHFNPCPIEGGRAAIQAAEAGDVDFILMDIQMPEVSGIDATLAIREMEKSRGGHLPIIAVTAHAFAEDRERCLAAGMDAYLSKPLRVDELVTTLEKLGLTLSRSAIPERTPPAAKPVEAPQKHVTELGTPLPTQAGGEHVRLIRGDPVLVSTVAEVFLEQTPLILRAIEAAIRQRSAAELAFHAHRLKGSLSYLEVPSLEAAARGLERQGKADRWDQVPVWWEELQSGLAQLKIELTVLLGTNPSSTAVVPPHD